MLLYLPSQKRYSRCTKRKQFNKKTGNSNNREAGEASSSLLSLCFNQDFLGIHPLTKPLGSLPARWTKSRTQRNKETSQRATCKPSWFSLYSFITSALTCNKNLENSFHTLTCFWSDLEEHRATATDESWLHLHKNITPTHRSFVYHAHVSPFLQYFSVVE